MKAVILVPRRADGGPRDKLWRWVRAWWAANLPELDIHEGSHERHEGLFNRSAACNRAAAAAGAWDVALIIDADVICDPGQVRESIDAAAAAGDHLVLPFDRRHNLTDRGSRRILEGYAGSWKPYIGRTYTDMCSSAVAVPRRLWDQAGGFDETFAGWGFEDNAFAAACQTFGRELERIPGELWHLWHPTAPEGVRTAPSFQANRARRELYDRAMGNPDLIRRLIAGETPELEPLPRRIESIPRILHRVVPATTSDQVEGWWQAFRDLHPGWELRTHRDPLKPRAWPLTAKHWAACETGAQLAGLIRLEALYRDGGIYVDSDCEPYRSLEPLLALHAFAAWEDATTVPDAVIGAEPEHPAIKAALELAIARLEQRAETGDRFTWSTGPGVLTELFPGRPDVLLLPPGALYPYHYREKHRRDEPHAESQPWAFLAHHWAGSWLAAGKPKRAAA